MQRESNPLRIRAGLESILTWVLAHRDLRNRQTVRVNEDENFVGILYRLIAHASILLLPAHRIRHARPALAAKVQE
jgi:hypothetical protein